VNSVCIELQTIVDTLIEKEGVEQTLPPRKECMIKLSRIIMNNPIFYFVVRDPRNCRIPKETFPGSGSAMASTKHAQTHLMFVGLGNSTVTSN
jgi:hypothetical protein